MDVAAAAPFIVRFTCICVGETSNHHAIRSAITQVLVIGGKQHAYTRVARFRALRSQVTVGAGGIPVYHFWGVRYSIGIRYLRCGMALSTLSMEVPASTLHGQLIDWKQHNTTQHNTFVFMNHRS